MFRATLHFNSWTVELEQAPKLAAGGEPFEVKTSTSGEAFSGKSLCAAILEDAEGSVRRVSPILLNKKI